MTHDEEEQDEVVGFDTDLELVGVYDCLTSLGFTEDDALRITMFALIRWFAMDVESIRECAAECGFALPDAAFHYSHRPYKDRN